MKKVLLIIYALLAVLVFCSCSSEVVDNSKYNIVTSFYPMYISALNIVDGANNVTLTNLTAQTTGCLHDYQITTSDMLKLNNADVLIVNGDGMENFIDKALLAYPNLDIINASKNIKENHESILHEEHEESLHHDEHEHGENSHYWVSVTLYIEQIKNIKDELIRLNPENSEIYEKNATEYINKLEDLKNRMHEKLDLVQNRNIVTFHEAFDFFAEEFDLNIVSVIEREPGTYPSSKEVAEIIDEIKNKNVNAIFTEPQYSRTAADTIARETNIGVYVLDPVVTGDMNKEAYINIMNQNLNNLQKALGS